MDGVSTADGLWALLPSRTALQQYSVADNAWRGPVASKATLAGLSGVDGEGRLAALTTADQLVALDTQARLWPGLPAALRSAQHCQPNGQHAAGSSSAQQLACRGAAAAACLGRCRRLEPGPACHLCSAPALQSHSWRTTARLQACAALYDSAGDLWVRCGAASKALQRVVAPAARLPCCRCLRPCCRPALGCHPTMPCPRARPNPCCSGRQPNGSCAALDVCRGGGGSAGFACQRVYNGTVQSLAVHRRRGASSARRWDGMQGIVQHLSMRAAEQRGTGRGVRGLLPKLHLCKPPCKRTPARTALAHPLQACGLWTAQAGC